MTQYGYVRREYPISTKDQIQLIEKMGCQEIFIENNPIHEDIELQELQKKLEINDQIVVYDLRTFGKRLSSLEKIAEKWAEKQVQVFFTNENMRLDVDQDFYMYVRMLNQMQKSLLKYQSYLGIEKAKDNGRFAGRPGVSDEKIAEIIKMRKADYSLRKIAKDCGISLATVHKYVKQYEDGLLE